MGLTVVFQMDPLETLNADQDSTIALAEIALKRGHTVYGYAPSQLSWRDNRLRARGQMLKLQDHGRLVIPSESKKDKLSSHSGILVDLEACDVLFIRQEPPFDLEYITTTYLLDHLKGKVFMVNAPDGIRQSPEKLLVTHFADLMPPTLITQDEGEIEDFWACHGTIVIKPLYAFGGEAVFRLQKDDVNFSALLEMFQKAYPKQPWVVQKFLPEVYQGDRRLFLIDGRPVGGFVRIPGSNSIRSNMARGGRPIPYTLTDKDHAICDRLGPKLQELGLMLVGIDLIGEGFLMEINVTCPTGFRSFKELYGLSIGDLIWDSIEEKLAKKGHPTL